MDMISELFSFLWNSFFALKGWQMFLWVVFVIYAVIRIYAFYDYAKEYGVLKGYRRAIFGNDGHIRLWHVVRMVFDLPMAAIGLFLPIIRKTLTFKLYQFEDDKIREAKEKAEREEREKAKEDAANKRQVQKGIHP